MLRATKARLPQRGLVQPMPCHSAPTTDLGGLLGAVFTSAPNSLCYAAVNGRKKVRYISR